MEAFKSAQLSNASNQNTKPKLFSHSRKLYPELVSLLNMQIKQEKLLKLERENNPRPQFF